MDYLVDGDSTVRQGTTNTAKEYVKDFVKGQYYDSSVGAVAETYYGKVKTTLDGMKKDATVKERLAAVKKVYEEAKTKIDEKYKKVVDAALVKGGKNIDSLYSGTNIKNMTTTDVAAMVKSAKADLAKATTLQGISAVIDSNKTKSDGSETTVLVGSYNEIERLRKSAFTTIDASIKGVYESDPSLNPGSTTASKEAYATFLETLASFGITEDQLPTKIYEEYKAKISAATSFEYYTKDDKVYYDTTTLAKEADKAISDASKNILATVRQAILDSYYKEIDASEKLTTEQAKVTCKGDVETTISTWFEYHSLTGSLINASVSNFVSYYVDVTDPTNVSEPSVGVAKDNKHGGLFDIEFMLDKDYASFNAERLVNKKATVADEITAKANEYIDADALYKSIITAEVGTGKEYADVAALATDVEVKTASATALRNIGTLNSTTGAPDGNTANLEMFVNAITVDKGGIVKTSGNDGGYLKTNTTGVLALLRYKTTVLGQLKTVYGNAITKFKASETDGLGGDVNNGYGLFIVDAVTGDDNDLAAKVASLFTTDDTVTTIHSKLSKSNSANWVGLVDSLGAQYHDYWDVVSAYYELDSTNDFAKYGKATLSEMWKTVQAAIDSIIKGDITSYDQLKEIMDGMDEKYGMTIENYAASQLKALADVKSTFVQANTGFKAEIATSRYNNWVAVANSGAFVFDSYSSVDHWFSLASTNITTAATASSDPVDLAHELNDAIVKGIGQVADYMDIAETAAGVKLTDTEKGYSDVKNLFSAMKLAISQCGTVAAVEAIIKDAGDGTFTIGTTAYQTTAIKAAADLGLAKSYADGAYDQLIKVVEGAIPSTVTGDELAAEKVAIEAIAENFTTDTAVAAAGSGKMGTNILGYTGDAGTVISGLVVGDFSGELTTALYASGALATDLQTKYKTLLESEYDAYVREMLIEHPELASSIRDGLVDDIVFTGATTYVAIKAAYDAAIKVVSDKII